MIYTVQPEERAVVKRFGAVITTTEPGLHFKLPFGIDGVQRVATERVLKEEFGFRTAAPGEPTRYVEGSFPDESLMLSGDLNIIDVEGGASHADRSSFSTACGSPRGPSEISRNRSCGGSSAIIWAAKS
jgi:hypothetical protein